MGTPDVTNWRPLTPPDAAAIMDGYPGPWWISGGWAVEAFTGTPRLHGDLDVECLRDDLALLRRHLAARYELWSAHSGSLTPLPPDDRPDAQADDVRGAAAHGVHPAVGRDREALDRAGGA